MGMLDNRAKRIQDKALRISDLLKAHLSKSVNDVKMKQFAKKIQNTTISYDELHSLSNKNRDVFV